LDRVWAAFPAGWDFGSGLGEPSSDLTVGALFGEAAVGAFSFGTRGFPGAATGFAVASEGDVLESGGAGRTGVFPSGFGAVAVSPASRFFFLAGAADSAGVVSGGELEVSGRSGAGGVAGDGPASGLSRRPVRNWSSFRKKEGMASGVVGFAVSAVEQGSGFEHLLV
jgi:hypothetical protein